MARAARVGVDSTGDSKAPEKTARRMLWKLASIPRLAALRYLAPANKVHIGETSGISSCIEALRTAGPEAPARAAFELFNLAANAANQDRIREAGGIPLLVTLLAGGSGPAAAGALWNLAENNASNQDAIREAGGIPPLVALLAAAASLEQPAAAAATRGNTVGALANLAANAANQDAIREAGGIPPLVALLAAGARSEVAGAAAGALSLLADNNETNKDVIREEGGLKMLIDMLSAGAKSDAAVNAAAALHSLSGRDWIVELVRERAVLRKIQ